MNLDNLITMANRIGDFFESYQNKSQAQESLAEHIASFWAPSMRSFFLEQIDSAETKEKLKPFVLQAILLHQDLLKPKVSAL